MTQKILRVGSSAAVTIPKKSLKLLGFDIGDTVAVTIDKKQRKVIIEPLESSVDHETKEWTEQFIKRYGKALRELSKK